MQILSLNLNHSVRIILIRIYQKYGCKMNLEITINEELKNAIKQGNKLRMETLRSLRATIIEFNKSGIGREMNDDDELKILQSAAKKRRDAIELYEKAGRTELSDKEKAELVIITEFLPKQLSEDEVKEIIAKVISDAGATGVKDMGKVMGAAMKELKGKADGNLVQTLVKSGLENL
jgi:uncharacterized protein YqeY